MEDGDPIPIASFSYWRCGRSPWRSKMKRQTLLLIAGLLVAIALTATAIDLFLPGRSFDDAGLGLGFLRRPRMERPEGPGGPGHWFSALPRASRSLAGIAALAGYGLVLSYLAPRRFKLLVNLLSGTPRELARYTVIGLAATVLLATLIFLAAMSLIAIPLVPLFSFGIAIGGMTGLVALAAAAGRRLRAWLGDNDQHTLMDLLIGLAVAMLLELVPLVGTLVLIVLGATGLGALLAAHLAEL